MNVADSNIDVSTFDFMQGECDLDVSSASAQALSDPLCYTWASPVPGGSYPPSTMDGTASRPPFLPTTGFGDSAGSLLDITTQDYAFGGIPWQANGGLEDESYSSYNGNNSVVSPMVDPDTYASPQVSWYTSPGESYATDGSKQITGTYSMSPQSLGLPEESESSMPVTEGIDTDSFLLGMGSLASQSQDLGRSSLLPSPEKEPKRVRFMGLSTSTAPSFTTSPSSSSSSSSSNSTGEPHINSRTSQTGDRSSQQIYRNARGRKTFACKYKDCSGSAFTRMADLERHMRHLHVDADKKERFMCDYATCSRSSTPFYRKDHYREHLREYHLEDLLKRGSNAGRSSSPRQRSHHHQHQHQHQHQHHQPHHGDASSSADKKGKKQLMQEMQLQNCKTDAAWWRCARCLKRVDIQSQGWTCPGCKGSIEEPRKAIRKSREDPTWPYGDSAMYQ